MQSICRSPFLLVIATLAVLQLSACGKDEIFRRVALTAEASVPSGHTEVTTTTLDVHFDAVEALAASHAFVIWSRTSNGTFPVAETASAGHVEINLATEGILASDILRVLITEEEAGTAAPNVIRGPVLLAGDPGGELEFGTVTAAAFEGASGILELENKTLTLTTTGLPALSTGYHYALWMIFPAHGDGDGHAHSHGEEAGEMIHMGELHDGHREAAGDRMLAEASAARISIESVNGTAAMGHHTIMHGEVVTEAEGGMAAEAEEDGHGGHMH